MKSFKMLIVAALGALSLSSCGYNDMVSKQENVDAQWAQVENVYQRRADLAAVNSILALGDAEGKLDELRRRYPNLDITSWSRENRVQMG